ncbi:MAG: hypothetical protein QM728_11650 [Gordonia sp. (in: high G+C Gram-positive bacteria)]|uniref:hypothetical protein n=1 Tax=Gordonia sp. (in: high G+C Gram-positive bacteria) TaxID=84139 RepID=UPI0039E5029A
MRRLASILGLLAAAVAALMVVQPASAGAQPATNVGKPTFAVTPDNQAIVVSVTSGSIKRVGDELVVNDARGAKTRVPLTVKNSPISARVAADNKSAVLKPMGYHEVLTYKRPLPRPMNKGQAWYQLNALANQNWGCAAGPTAVGAIIGALVGIFLILAWPITTPIGAAIGAYVGYQNCGRGRWMDRYRGETIRAFWRWWNMPG